MAYAPSEYSHQPGHQRCMLIKYLLCALLVVKDPIRLHVDSEDPDRTRRMPRLGKQILFSQKHEFSRRKMVIQDSWSIYGVLRSHVKTCPRNSFANLETPRKHIEQSKCTFVHIYTHPVAVYFTCKNVLDFRNSVSLCPSRNCIIPVWCQTYKWCRYSSCLEKL